MEVAHNLHFEFKSPPHDSAPSTPKRFGEYYFSAPTSPSHLSHFYRDFDDLFDGQSGGGSAVVSGSSAATVPFQWEEKPGTPKSPSFKFKNDEFAFDVSDDWETASLPADELFDGGVIKPLKPPPRKNPASISLSPLSQRGRERGLNPSKSSSRRAARSLSPLRDTQYTWEEEKEQPPAPTNPNNTGCSALSASVKVQKKWRFKDFFLFRSASEGRAADKDPLKKYTAAFRHYSFRAIDSPGSGSGSRRRGPVSPHELHYTVNRAVSEDLKRKTFLPYKQGILGRLAFNPAVHALANGFGLSRK